MSPIRPMRNIENELSEHQAACRACIRCVSDGTLAEAGPTFEGGAGARFLLVGQAPGPVERASRRPFMGRAGQELARWMARAGFASEAEFRRLTYITSLARCFPGRSPSGSGDRPPSTRAVRNCAPWLERELELLRPRVVIPVGQMAIRRFLGPGPLEDRVGATFSSDPLLLPLPHPSGQSRWLNHPANRRLLERALDALSEQRVRFGDGAGARPGRYG